MMEILREYNFLSPEEQATKSRRERRRAWMVQLCDGNIWRFHVSEFPDYKEGMKLSTIAIIIKNEILRHLYPGAKVELRREKETGHIVIRVTNVKRGKR